MAKRCIDWSGLPMELLNLIGKKLSDPFDFVYFRAVCRRWKSSVRYSDHMHHPQSPWLLEFSPNYTYSSLHYPTTQLRFYSIHTRKIITIPIEKSVWLRGSCYRYIPTFEDDDDLTLFNPLTGYKFAHPYNIHNPECYSPWMVWTGEGPICDQNILIVDRSWHPEDKGRWIFYDPQRRKWNQGDGFFRKFCYWQGMLFSDTGHKIKGFNLSSKALLYEISYPQIWDQFDYERYFYLVESSGEILSVYWIRNCQQSVEESMVYIYKLDLNGKDGKPCWVRINDIGDRILFLEVRNGFSMTAAPCSTDELKGGRIYFIDPDNGKPYVHHVIHGTVKSLPCPFRTCTWFVPSLCN